MTGHDDAAARRFHAIYDAVVGRCDAVFHVPPDAQRADRPHIDVFHWPPAQRPYHLLMTAGMSTRLQGTDGTPSHRPRVELYAKLPATLDRVQIADACRALWRVAQWPWGSVPARALSEWHMVHGLAPMTEGSALDAFLLTMPMTDDAFVDGAGSRLGAQWLQAYGITDAERREAERRGPERIVQFARALVRLAGPFTDPLRRDCSADVPPDGPPSRRSH